MCAENTEEFIVILQQLAKNAIIYVNNTCKREKERYVERITH